MCKYKEFVESTHIKSRGMEDRMHYIHVGDIQIDNYLDKETYTGSVNLISFFITDT